MKVSIDKQSELSVCHQLHEQIIFLIGTGELSIGDTLPSVRELARRLKVHHNTAGHAYADLVREGWLVTRPGRRLVVVQPAKDANGRAGEFEDLDGLINRTILVAQERGYSLQQLAVRIRERLLAQEPDHLLVVEPERALGELMREEIREVIGQAPATCSISTLQQNPSMAVGAVLLTPNYLVDGLECIPSKDRRVVRITYSSVDGYLAAVRNLSQPSVVGVLSISAAGLKTTNGLLAPAVGGRHSLRLFLMERTADKGSDDRLCFRRYMVEEYPTGPGVRGWAAANQVLGGETSVSASGSAHIKGAEELPLLSSADLQGIDLLFCDSIAYRAVEHPRATEYRLISPESLRQIASAAQALVAGDAPTGVIQSSH